MAVTTENADQLEMADAVDGSDTKIAAIDDAKVRIKRFDFTQGAAAGDANSLANLAVFGPGKYRILPSLSSIAHSAFGSGRTLDVGHTGYTKHDGTAVVADVDTFLDGADVAAAGRVDLALPVDGFVLDTKTEFTIQAKVLGDTIPAAATLKGWIAYVTP